MPYSLSRLAIWIIVATLPLCFLADLPDEKDDLHWVILIFILHSFRYRIANEMAVIMLLFLWAVSPARILLQQIEFLTARPQQAVVKIEQLQPERTKIRILSVGHRQIFPPVYAMVSFPQHEQPLCAGQRWQMRLRLRAVHARLNEGSFDSQRYALANSLPLTGRILSLQPINTRCNWRQQVIHSSQKHYGHLARQAIMTALAFGERGSVSREMNQLLKETGTAHLMAISGMHISLAASMGWLIARAIQLLFPAHRIGYRFPLLVSLLLAMAYTWLSGGNPPATRAMLALCVWSVLRLHGRCCSSWQVWRLCIGTILFFDPLSVLSESLWLSATAVAGLLFWYHWFPLPRRFAGKKRWLVLQLFHLQLGMFLLLMPLQMLIFHGISLSALIANLWAVPVITLLTVPLILGAVLLTAVPEASAFLWWLANGTLEWMFNLLQLLPAGWITVNRQALWLSLLAWLLVMIWRFCWWRSSPVTILSLCLSLLLWRMSVKAPEWRLDMLDVGHGLAVAISRGNSAILYDTGNRWEGGDAATSQILPWLRWQGLELEQIILSHDHLDHTGGLESLLGAFPQVAVRSEMGRAGHLPCHKGTRWRWRSLDFEVLWPLKPVRSSGNNQSCVIAVSDGKWRVLLTGDIEAPAELKLVSTYRDRLRSDVLQVPHHGSGTSSVPPLLRAVSGQVALASVARYSAWKLPAERIINRYAQNHYRWYDTAVNGQISVQFFSDRWQVEGLRAQILPRWYHQWFGVPRYSR